MIAPVIFEQQTRSATPGQFQEREQTTRFALTQGRELEKASFVIGGGSDSGG